MQIPSVVPPLPAHQTAGVGSSMSYAAQWAANVGQHTISHNSVSAQGELVANSGTLGHNGVLYNPYNPNAMRQHTSQLQLPVVGAQTVNQPSPNQTANGYCQPQLPSGYSYIHPAILAALNAQSGAPQSRSSNYCVQQGSSQPGNVRGALLSPHTFQLAHPATHNVSNGTVGLNQQQSLHGPIQYISTQNGLQFAAFPSGLSGSHGATSSMCSYPHNSQLSQQSGTIAGAQFRNYDSLKHFGVLPHPQNHKRNKSMTTSKTNLYISGLSESDTDDTVRSLVEDVVRPKSCKAMLLNGKCKGSGFIDCASEDDAVKALNHLSEVSKTSGRKLTVKYALENEKDLLNVYVRNLPRTGFTKETLESLFRPYGQVTSVKLLETDGAYTGIGFVRFASAEQAQRAVESMNDARCVLVDSPGGGKPICCKLADKADPKRRAVNAAAALAAAATVTQNTSGRINSKLNSGQGNPLSIDSHIPQTLSHKPLHQQQLVFQTGVLTNGNLLSLPSIDPTTNLTFQNMSPSGQTGYCQPNAFSQSICSSSPYSHGGLLDISPGLQSSQGHLNNEIQPSTDPNFNPMLMPTGNMHADLRYQSRQAAANQIVPTSSISNTVSFSSSDVSVGQYSQGNYQNVSPTQPQLTCNYANQYLSYQMQPQMSTQTTMQTLYTTNPQFAMPITSTTDNSNSTDLYSVTDNETTSGTTPLVTEFQNMQIQSFPSTKLVSFTQINKDYSVETGFDLVTSTETYPVKSTVADSLVASVVYSTKQSNCVCVSSDEHTHPLPVIEQEISHIPEKTIFEKEQLFIPMSMSKDNDPSDVLTIRKSRSTANQNQEKPETLKEHSPTVKSEAPTLNQRFAAKSSSPKNRQCTDRRPAHASCEKMTTDSACTPSSPLF